MDKICAFSGHRSVDLTEFEKVKAETYSEIEELIKEGYTVFRAGGAMGYDMLAAEIVLKLRETYPQIKLHLYIPCPNQDRSFSPVQKEIYKRQLEAADETFLLSDHYYRGCMLKRNRDMVDGAGALICYLRKDSGGTAYTVSYAEKKGLNIIKV